MTVSRADRRTYIGASDTTRLAKGHGQQIWLEKTGRAEPQDLSLMFNVQLGSFTENFILDWTEKLVDINISRRQNFLQADDRSWLCATLDGISDGSPWGGQHCVFEAKHSNQWATDQSIFDWYYWQGQQQAYVGGFDDACIPYAAGNNWGGILQIEVDPFRFEDEMLPRLDRLWKCIEDDTPYEDEAIVAAPPLDGLITYDLSPADIAKEFNWGPRAVELGEALVRDKKTADGFDGMKKELRELMPEDARIVKLVGLKLQRSKTGTVAVHFGKEASA